MRLFDFVKRAGKYLGIGKAEAMDEAPSADAIKREIESHGLEADGLSVEVEGDTVTVSGKTASQELREKIIMAAGNIAGVGKVREAIEAATGSDDSDWHTVKKGDTLWAIASKFYGNGSKYQQIFEANRPMLSHPDKIYPGQKLRIPKL